MAALPSSLPPVGTLDEYVSLGTQTGGDAIQLLTILQPYLLIITFVFDILDLAGIIPNPLTLLLSLFAGRPRELASLEQAGRLMTARNPAARQAGIMLERMVKEWDIVTSEGGSGRAILDSWAHLFVTNLVNQGVATLRAQEILVAATSEAAQSGLPLETELTVPLPQGILFNAPPSLASDFQTQYQNWIAKGKTIDQALNLAEQWLWKTAPLADLFKVWLGQYIPPNPPPQEVVPGQNGSCPQGYTLDPTSEMCVLQGTTPTPLPPGGQPITGQPDPDGDEITDDLCAQIQTAAQTIASALQNQPGNQGGGDNGECCQNVVNAITSISTALASILAAIGPGGAAPAPPVDLSGVVAALDQLVAAVGALTPAAPVDLTGVVAALNQIATELAGGNPVDLSGVVNALKQIFSTIDVPMPVYEQLAKDGYIDPKYLQLFEPGQVGPGSVTIGASWWNQWWKRFMSGSLGIDPSNPGDHISTGAPISKQIAASLTSYLSTADTLLAPIVVPFIKTLIAQVSPTTTPPLGSTGIEENTPVDSAVSLALTAGVAGWLASFLGWDGGESIAKIVEFVAGVAGFEELKDVQLGPYVREGLAKIATYRARALFQQEIPSSGTVTEMLARRILDPTLADTLLQWNGVHSVIRPQTVAAGYRPVSPRALATALQDTPFPAAQLQAILEDNAMSPANVQFMLGVLQYQSTKNVRNAYVTELLTAHARGVVSEDELNTALQGLGWSNDAIAFVQQRAALQRRVTLASKVEAQVIPLVATGGMTPDQGTAQLEAAGIQDWYTQLEITLATTKADVAALRKEAAAEAKLATQRTRAATSAAVNEYRGGTLDLAGFSAALLAAGVDPVIAASAAAVQQAQRTGRLKLIYGQLLLPPDAKVLEDRVNAIGAQVTSKLITADDALAQLTLLGVDENERNAKVAQWAASIKASVGPVILLSPLTGQPPK